VLPVGLLGVQRKMTFVRSVTAERCRTRRIRGLRSSERTPECRRRPAPALVHRKRGTLSRTLRGRDERTNHEVDELPSSRRENYVLLLESVARAEAPPELAPAGRIDVALRAALTMASMTRCSARTGSRWTSCRRSPSREEAIWK